MLDGKVAVITGAGSGMGKASVKVFVREGAKVVAADISGAEQDTAAEVGEGVLPVHCDVDPGGGRRGARARRGRGVGRLDVVLNVAGIADAGMLADITRTLPPADGRRPVRCDLRDEARHPGMLADGGAIVNWSSLGGLGGAAYTTVYSAAKHGVVGATKAQPSSTGRTASASTPCALASSTRRSWAHTPRAPGILEKAALGRGGQPARGGRGRAPFSRRTGRRSSPAPSSRSMAAGAPSSRDRTRRALRRDACRASRMRGFSPDTARTSTTSCCPGCCTRRSCAAPSPGPHPEHRHRRRAAQPGVHSVFTAADLNPDAKEQWHTSVGRREPGDAAPTARRRRGPLRRRPGRTGGRRRPVRAEDAAELVDVTTKRCRRSSTTRRPSGPTRSSREPWLEPHRRDRRPPVVGARDVFAVPPTWRARTIHQQAYGRCRSKGAGSSSTTPAHRRADHLRLDSVPARGAPPAPACSAYRSTASVLLWRDTGGGFGQKVVVQREEMCLMLAARKVGAPVKWIEDRRENLLAAGKSRHEHADVRMAFDGDGVIQAAQIDFVPDCGAYPSPWPVGPRDRVGMIFPGPVPGAPRRLPAKRSTPTRPGDVVPGAVAVRAAGP